MNSGRGWHSQFFYWEPVDRTGASGENVSPPTTRLRNGHRSGISAWKNISNLAIRHTMTNSSRKQQHCCCSNNSSIATRRAAALCMHLKLTYRLLRRHLSHHRTYFYPGTKKKEVKEAHTKKMKSRHPRFEPRTPRSTGTATCDPTLFLVYIDGYWYVYIRTNWRLGYFEKKHSTRRRETTRARPRPPPAESGERSKVKHVERTPHRMVDLISS